MREPGEMDNPYPTDSRDAHARSRAYRYRPQAGDFESITLMAESTQTRDSAGPNDVACTNSAQNGPSRRLRCGGDSGEVAY